MAGIIQGDVGNGVAKSIAATLDGEARVKQRSIEELLTRQNELLYKIVFLLAVAFELDVPDDE